MEDNNKNIVYNVVKKSTTRFIPLPIKILESHQNITLNEFVLMCYICNGKNHTIYDTNQYLSTILHCNIRTVIKYLKHLKQLGYIQIDKEKSKHRSITCTFEGIKIFKLNFNMVKIDQN